MKNRLMESLDRKVGKDLEVRRYSLPNMISESYKMMYSCDEGTNFKKLVESHLDDVRNNPSDTDRLSRQLSILKEVSRLMESHELSDKDLVERKPKVPAKSLKENTNRVAPTKKDESVHCEECDDTDLNEETELTDEELDELTKHLEEIRKKNSSGPKKTDESVEDNVDDEGKLVEEEDQDTVEGKENRVIVHPKYCNESLKPFADKSKGKAFMKTFKKLDSKLHEGTALTRQESIGLYKAANSAMTHLSVELEHNPEFLKTFKESVSILSVDVNKLLESLSNGKAPSKKTMKSLAKFSEAILREEAEEQTMTSEEAKQYWNDNRKSDPVLAKYKSYDEWYKGSKENGYIKDTEVDEGLFNKKPKAGDAMRAQAKDAKSDADNVRAQMEKLKKLQKTNESTDSEKTYSDEEKQELYKNWCEHQKAEGVPAPEYHWKAYTDTVYSTWDNVLNKSLHEAADEDEEEEIPEDEVDTEEEDIESPEEEDEDFIGDDEGDIDSEEADDFDQEYADARVELHQKLVSDHAEDEDPAIQEKIAQDAEEVMSLPGITDEQIAEISGTEPDVEETPADEEEPVEDDGAPTEEESEEPTDDSDITDEELEELKRHLKEMRESKKRK